VNVRTSFAAILVQRTGLTVMSKAVLQHGHVEPGEVHQLHVSGIGQQMLQVRTIEPAAAQRLQAPAAPDARVRRRTRVAQGTAGRDVD
jgi:hypothetical protein